MFTKQLRGRTTDLLRQVQKPLAIELYSRLMGGVDRADQKLWNLLNCHRTNKWWIKILLYIFELTMVNARIIFQECNGNVARLKRYPATFRNDLITGLTVGYFRPVKRIGRLIALAAEDRLSEYDHKRVPLPGWNCKFETNSESCKVCSDKGQVASSATELQLGATCFDQYHTLLNYQTCCKDYGNGEFHGPVTIPVAEWPLKGVASNNKCMVGTLLTPKFSGGRTVPSTDQTGGFRTKDEREGNT